MKPTSAASATLIPKRRSRSSTCVSPARGRRRKSGSRVPSPQPTARARHGPRASTAQDAGRRRSSIDRSALAPGAIIDGPAIVIQDDTTLLISPGWHAVVDAFGNIMMEHA